HGRVVGLELDAGPLDRRAVELGVRLAADGLGEELPCLAADELVQGPPEQARALLVDELVAPLAIHREEAVGDARERVRAQLLALAQRALVARHEAQAPREQ